MKLFYSSGASSLAPHILLEESNLTYTAEKVNLDHKTWAQGDYNTINPKSYVPALETESGSILTECAVILEYIARQVPEKALIAGYATAEYWQQRTWLNYIATELHKNFISPFRKGNWLPNTAESKELVYQRVLPRLKYVDQQLADQTYLVNNQFCVADAYLFVMTNWLQRLDYGFNDLANLERFDSAIRLRSAVQRVLKQEGKPHSLTEQ
ncbi:glutathione binding-like protein [Lactobacillus sp. ESL0731]|uniref:glutathione S-transferase N-terminal domain-containing protein n=1 Tax=unclassified Lactobacillus TaxID=2620435 RepID=UPI0023FA08A8|nr:MULTISPECIES: glutathione S-transferase N-terminal domain-containing protein [unclassified Lactobacillus]WEV50630.1 glutathione binding-like protein [Lactobacillus sp. ESL0700]WEV61760.1 glutathione binding-like protein [Lactobacillus sp. ESL0731]